MIIAANWKMNPLPCEAVALFEGYCSDQRIVQARSDVVCFLPSCYFARAEQAFSRTAIQWGAQNSFPASSGAYTGEISAEMVSGCGGKWVLAGHSERRILLNETDDFISQKLVAALKAGLRAVLCVGEEIAQRQAGQHAEYVRDQLLAGLKAFCGESDHWQENHLPRLVVAYEPVWAIGTGLVARESQIEAMHSHVHDILRDQFARLSSDHSPAVLYGGSVNKDNAASILGLPMVGGALVGGASLSADGFAAIVRCADAVL